MASTADEPKATVAAQVPLPRITIKFCVQCKWNLRAAYFAQELLQTFSTSIGEISLVPVTGGIFIVTILHATASSEVAETLLWDRKVEGGFPETKELKNRVRNIIDPSKDMGHIDRRLKKDKAEAEALKEGESGQTSAATTKDSGASTVTEQPEPRQEHQNSCEDCKP